jgi:hypothetical protein
MPWDKTLPLQHPYQIVRLKFVPAGMDTTVTAVDKIDSGSVPNLKPGQPLNITYDAVHPRIAILQGGTRLFPSQTLKNRTAGRDRLHGDPNDSGAGRWLFARIGRRISFRLRDEARFSRSHPR